MMVDTIYILQTFEGEDARGGARLCISYAGIYVRSFVSCMYVEQRDNNMSRRKDKERMRQDERSMNNGQGKLQKKH